MNEKRQIVGCDMDLWFEDVRRDREEKEEKLSGKKAKRQAMMD